jgi:hypothetical protein
MIGMKISNGVARAGTGGAVSVKSAITTTVASGMLSSAAPR